MKRLLIIKASKDICGDEIGLITHQAKLLGMEVEEISIRSEAELQSSFERFSKMMQIFDYFYLCTHGDGEGFEIDMGAGRVDLSWHRFSGMLCESEILNEETIILLACCRGGLFKVTSAMMAACNFVKFVCGVKWSVSSWDLVTGFIVFLYQMEKKNSEPVYAAKKASKATDYTFECYDREEIESNPQFLTIRHNLFVELGWTDDDGNWITHDPIIKKNVGVA